MKSNFWREIERFLPGFRLSQADELAAFASIILEPQGAPGGLGLREAPMFTGALISSYCTVCGRSLVCWQHSQHLTDTLGCVLLVEMKHPSCTARAEPKPPSEAQRIAPRAPSNSGSPRP